MSETTDAFCDACGHALVHHCAGCGSRYRETPFCGACGTQWYSVPACTTCGSWLELEDMGADTAKLCCGKGRRKGFGRPAAKSPYTDEDYGGGDDIPF